MTYECTVGAAKWLRKIGSNSLVVIEELDGTPFIGSMRERSSKKNMEMYWVERDQWRAYPANGRGRTCLMPSLY